MVSSDVLTQSPVGNMFQTAPAVALDADFEARWAAWVARGQAHEQRVRRRLVAWGCALAIGGAGVYAFFR